MGEGVEIRCRKCGADYIVFTGVGMMYPSDCAETMGKIRSGEYGDELKDLILSDPDLAVDCEMDLYVCECGHWQTEKNLDVYEPVDNEVRNRHVNKEQPVIAFKDMLKKDYRIVKHYMHVCEKCGKEMKLIKNADSYARRYGLSCPECGTKNKAELRNRILWD